MYSENLLRSPTLVLKLVKSTLYFTYTFQAYKLTKPKPDSKIKKEKEWRSIIMNIYRRRWIAVLVISVLMIQSLTACGNKETNSKKETEASADTNDKDENKTKESEKDSADIETKDDSNAEPEVNEPISKPSEEDLQAASEGVPYVAKDGSLELTLPDKTWQNTVDTEGKLTFTSTAGVIDILRLKGEDLTNAKIPATQEEYQTTLTTENPDNYEMVSFEADTNEGMRMYKAVVKYTDSDSTYKYSISYGSFAGDQGFICSAMIKSDDESVLEPIKNALYSFQILK